MFPDPLPFRRLGHEGLIGAGGTTIQVRAFFVIAVALALAAAGGWVLTRARAGRALRAIADDAEAARMVRFRPVKDEPLSATLPAIAQVAPG